jgi:hypothetical protein
LRFSLNLKFDRRWETERYDWVGTR